jgi:hypothetical protein
MMFLLKKQKYRVSSGFLFKREEVMKKLLLFIIANVFFFSYANAEDKVGFTQEVGLSIPFYYHYQEPDFMYLEANIKEETLESYGLTYNLKNAFSLGGYLNELELDASWQEFNWDYWSDVSSHEDTGGEIINARLLYGLQASDKMMIKTGFGYRYLDHQWAGKLAGTYDREQRNKYIPFIVELNTPIAGIDGKLKIEYDHMMYGHMKTASVGATKEGSMRNDDGFMWKTSYKFPYAGFYLEPYYEFMSLEDSNWDWDSCSCREPRNTTQEYGVKFAKKFGEDGLSSVADSKRLLQADVVNDFGDKFSFGINYFLAELDTGIYGLTGMTLDEEDYSFSILSEFKINDFVGLEVGFTDFGKATLKGDDVDSFTTDGRWGQGTYAAGTSISPGADNFRNTFESYSGSLAVKPNFDFGNGLFVNADLGIHRWFQSEVWKYVGSGGSTVMYSYADWDAFYGIGAGIKKGDFEVSVNFKDYDMYYDAEIIGASLKYNF